MKTPTLFESFLLWSLYIRNMKFSLDHYTTYYLEIGSLYPLSCTLPRVVGIYTYSPPWDSCYENPLCIYIYTYTYIHTHKCIFVQIHDTLKFLFHFCYKFLITFKMFRKSFPSSGDGTINYKTFCETRSVETFMFSFCSFDYEMILFVSPDALIGPLVNLFLTSLRVFLFYLNYLYSGNITCWRPLF